MPTQPNTQCAGIRSWSTPSATPVASEQRANRRGANSALQSGVASSESPWMNAGPGRCLLTHRATTVDREIETTGGAAHDEQTRPTDSLDVRHHLDRAVHGHTRQP